LQASTRKGATLEFAKHALVEALEARDLAYQSGQSYTIPKLDYVAIPSKGQRLEHWRDVKTLDEPDNTYYHILRMEPPTTKQVIREPSANWEKFVKSSLKGFAQSRLYIDS
jgi:hypothetical protein